MARVAGLAGRSGAARRNRRPRWLLRGFAWLLGLLLLLGLLWQGWYFMQVLWWVKFDPGQTSFMQRRLTEMQSKNPRAALRQQWVPYERISSHLKRAVVAAEDDRFLDHEGFDWTGIQRALEKNLRRGKPVAGGSTISQQLAKNLFLSGERSYWRKAQEAAITAMLELLMDKRRILEIYLNVAEWGEGVFGAEAAARHHYGISAAALAPEQAARLAAMLPRPRYFDRHRDSAFLGEQAARIQARMHASQIP